MRYVKRVLISAVVCGVLLGLSACVKKVRPQGSFTATECKSVCEKNECKTRCISADGSFK